MYSGSILDPYALYLISSFSLTTYWTSWLPEYFSFSWPCCSFPYVLYIFDYHPENKLLFLDPRAPSFELHFAETYSWVQPWSKVSIFLQDHTQPWVTKNEWNIFHRNHEKWWWFFYWSVISCKQKIYYS